MKPITTLLILLLSTSFWANGKTENLATACKSEFDKLFELLDKGNE